MANHLRADPVITAVWMHDRRVPYRRYGQEATPPIAAAHTTLDISTPVVPAASPVDTETIARPLAAVSVFPRKVA